MDSPLTRDPYMQGLDPCFMYDCNFKFNRPQFSPILQQEGPARPQYNPNPNLLNRLSIFNGENDVYGIDIAPLSIFENQVIPVNIHNLLTSFQPNLATKFIPKWNQYSRKRTYIDFNYFRRKMSNRAFFFVEESSGVFVHCKEFRVKIYFVPPVENKDINSFCWTF